jgi:RNA polymerase sigma-54 factor
MPIRHTQSLRQTPTVSPQLVLANELLQFSSLELEQAIAQELAENPALELSEIRRCPYCGSEMADGYCPSCGAPEVPVDEEWADQRYVEGSGDYGSLEPDATGDWEDPVSRLVSRTTLADHVLQQARLNLPAEDVVIAAHLVESLDSRGFLCCDLDEVASAIGVERERVERVLSTVQRLEPVGIAAQDTRQCLLIQIEHLRGDGVEHPLAEILVLDHWDMLGRYSLSRVAREVGTTVDEVHEALCFIRENLNPYPAHVSWVSRHDSPPEDTAVCPQPDVIIRESKTVDGEYEVELPKAREHRLRISSVGPQTMDELGVSSRPSDQQRWEQWKKFRARARLFVKSIEQRWRTLRELTDCLIDCQRGFLVRGEAQLKPLTRARVAEMMGVHESTVSRAVAGKYVQLPCGEIVPLDKFFDSAAPIKRMIEDLVDAESEPLSDSMIADKLSEQGYDVARRTVAKYRNALGILPYSLRRRRKDLSP